MQELCEKLCVISETETKETLINAINSERMRPIFTDIHVNISYLNKLYNKLSTDIIQHIITTRKIGIFSGILLVKIIQILKTDALIAQFFAFYTHEEIINIIEYDGSGFGQFKLNKKTYIYTTALQCLCGNINIRLFLYMIDYLEKYNLPILIHCNKYNMNILFTIDDEHIIMINRHDKYIIFKRSLRAAWIYNCIML